MTTASKGIDTRSQRVWQECVRKENGLRLKWFVNNKEKLLKLTQVHRPARTGTNDLQDEADDLRVKRYRTATRRGLNSPPERPLPDLDPDCYMNIMKPVDQNINDLLYQCNQRNRLIYLKERVKVLPEDRYYFTETSSYVYGWKMFFHEKLHPEKRYGKVQILRDTFYRRSGLGRDPDNYRETARFSPTVCNCA